MAASAIILYKESQNWLQSEQLRVHEKKEEEMGLKLEELMKTAPSLKAKGHVVQDFFYKERFLYQEVCLFHSTIYDIMWYGMAHFKKFVKSINAVVKKTT